MRQLFFQEGKTNMNTSAQSRLKEVKSIYLHIPFCSTKCPYCDFASWANSEHLIDNYFNALTNEIETKCNAYTDYRNAVVETPQRGVSTIKTIFIGGGTPSLIPSEYYKKLFHELKKYFVFSENCEITLELNPGTAREDYLKGYKELGINRISIGAQSFNQQILDLLGRKHSVADTVYAIEQVKNAGFKNFSLDLIYAVPEMKKEIWLDTIYRAIEFAPKHISAYSLTIEKNTPFASVYSDSKLLLSDDFTYELYMDLCIILKKESFIHYEISNFAKKDFESRHNINYWDGGDFFAFGNSAHRCLNGMRTKNLRNLQEYINNPYLEEIVDLTSDKFDKVMLNLRLNRGVEFDLLKQVSEREENDLTKLLTDLSAEGYLNLRDDKVFLTDKGFFVSNEILVKLAQ